MAFNHCVTLFLLLFSRERCESKAKAKATLSKLRVVTWNVAMNKQMGGGFTNTAIDRVLGLDAATNKTMPAIYAIGLQEDCWSCNQKSWPRIADRFLQRINSKGSRRKYRVIGVEGTRANHFCQLGCLLMHGSVVLIVIAKHNLGRTALSFRHNEGCSSKFIANVEKGVAALKYRVKPSGKSLCFATAHLDSAEPKYRRQCIKKFFATAEQETSWSRLCDFQFIFGDFNTRTGKKRRYGPTELNKTQADQLSHRDELTGKRPFGNGTSWSKNLLTFINFIQRNPFVEEPVRFWPTYSVRPAKSFCQGRSPCYRRNRAISWTDRIIYTKGECLEYDAIYEEYGDHYPVFAEFLLTL